MLYFKRRFVFSFTYEQSSPDIAEEVFMLFREIFVVVSVLNTDSLPFDPRSDRGIVWDNVIERISVMQPNIRMEALEV